MSKLLAVICLAVAYYYMMIPVDDESGKQLKNIVIVTIAIVAMVLCLTIKL